MSDTVLRVLRRERYGTVHLHAADEDQELSWKAVGIHTYLTTRPDGWEFQRRDLVNRHSDGVHAVKTGLKELRGAGYLRMERDQARDGQFEGWRWYVSEVPLEEGEWEECLERGEIPPTAGNPTVGKTDRRKTGPTNREQGSREQGNSAASDEAGAGARQEHERTNGDGSKGEGSENQRLRLRFAEMPLVEIVWSLEDGEYEEVAWNELLAPLIRDVAWCGKGPPPKPKGWNLGRELSRVKRDLLGAGMTKVQVAMLYVKGRRWVDDGQAPDLEPGEPFGVSRAMYESEFDPVSWHARVEDHWARKLAQVDQAEEREREVAASKLREMEEYQDD